MRPGSPQVLVLGNIICFFVAISLGGDVFEYFGFFRSPNLELLAGCDTKLIFQDFQICFIFFSEATVGCCEFPPQMSYGSSQGYIYTYNFFFFYFLLDFSGFGMVKSIISFDLVSS
jgi:hypothetical protein